MNLYVAFTTNGGVLKNRVILKNTAMPYKLESVLAIESNIAEQFNVSSVVILAMFELED